LTQASSAFVVVCLGEALWDLPAPAGVPFASAASLALRPGGAAVNAALALARADLRVGLAAVMGDDALGRALAARVAEAGVDTGGVVFAPPRTGLVFAERAGEGMRIVAYRAADEPAARLPARWRARVLLITGLSPRREHATVLREAAREGRRRGATVVIDVNARRRLWTGKDARWARGVLREADVVKHSAEDLRVMRLGEEEIAAVLRREAVQVMTDGPRAARARGTFGEVGQAPREVADGDPIGAGDAFAAAICASIARAEETASGRFWEGVLAAGHEAARVRMLG
jgi:sugar/nucleoside kinase (ribokinase family)